MSVHYVFVHGWGTDPDFWERLRPHFPEKQSHFLNLGFIGPDKRIENHKAPSDSKRVYITHSLGTLWALKNTRAHMYDQYGDVQANVANSLACDFPCHKNAAILEIGCGTGFLTAHLARKYAGHQLHITDVSPRMLEQTKSRFSGMSTRFFILDAEKEQTGETYDLITASMVCQWFEDLEEGL